MPSNHSVTCELHLADMQLMCFILSLFLIMSTYLLSNSNNKYCEDFLINLLTPLTTTCLYEIISVLIQIVHFVERSFCMIVIDYHDKRPIYEQVIERFQVLILNGALEPDEQLPSVRSLAVDLSINPSILSISTDNLF